MFIASSALTDGDVLEADLCIVGSGPAGLALAREYAGCKRPGGKRRVIVLEAGSHRVSHRAQSLYRAELSGAPNHAATHSRFRAYGGSATRWTGQCVPLESIDFEHRSAIAHSGWPFDLAHLSPFYQRAEALFGLVPPAHLDGQPEQDFSRASADLQRSLIRFARPADLGERLRGVFAASDDVDIVLDASVVDIVLDDARRRVVHVRCQGAGGRRLMCRARHFVLACGGIENARLLLAANSQVPAGIGNERDVVGRYFIDHPYLTTGFWTPSGTAVSTGLHVIDDFERVAQQRGAHSVFSLEPALRRREGLAGCVGYFIHREPWQLTGDYHSPGGRAVVHAAELLRNQRSPDRDIVQSLNALAKDPVSAIRLTRAALSAGLRPSPRPALRLVLEATPRRDSRVTLVSERDALGLPRARIAWLVDQDDWRGADRLRRELARCIRSNGLGELVDDRTVDRHGWPVSMSGGKHHMGTTRMHVDPAFGVVDEHARVHSTDNLFMAGSSVFPTGGWANPTLTIVALAIRLADRLRPMA